MSVKLGGGIFIGYHVKCEDLCCEHCYFVAVGGVLLSETASVRYGSVCRASEVVIPDSVVERVSIAFLGARVFVILHLVH